MHFGKVIGMKLLTATASGVHVITVVSLLILFVLNNMLFVALGWYDVGNNSNRSCVHGDEANRTATIVPPVTAVLTPAGPLIVLFTTFKETSDRIFFQSNTVRNWALHRPLLQPVLFTTDDGSYLTRLARSKGWDVYHVPRANDDGTPFLKDMIDFVRDRYRGAIYYGFANGDILFDDGLLQTLKGLWRKSDRMTDHVVIGRRINMKLDTSSWRPLYKPAEINALAAEGGHKLFIPDAEDYFFFGGEYPWDKIPDVVMGRPGYDNYIVYIAIESSLAVIDVTKTMLAFHQTGLDGDFAGTRNTDRRHNSRLIGTFDTWKGMVVSAQYRTHFDVTGDLCVEEGVPIWKLTRRRKEIEAAQKQAQQHRIIKNAIRVTKAANATQTTLNSPARTTRPPSNSTNIPPRTTRPPSNSTSSKPIKK